MASLKVAQETAQQWQTLHGYADRIGYISDPQGEGVTGQCVMGLVPCSSDSYTWGHDAHGCSKGGWVTAGLSVPCSIWYVAQLRGKEQTENHF